MADPTGEVSKEQRDTLVDEFETYGFATFVIGDEAALYEVLMDYVRKNSVFTYTSIDEAEGTITVTKRPLGSLEFS